MTAKALAAKWIILRCENGRCPAFRKRWVMHTTDHAREGWCPECLYPGARVAIRPDETGTYRAAPEHVAEGGELPDV